VKNALTPTGFVAFGLVLFAIAGAQLGCSAARPITLDAIYGPSAVDFDGPPPPRVEWLPSGEAYRVRRPDQTLVFSITTGEAVADADEDALKAALSAMPEIGDGAARATATAKRNDTAGTALIEHKGALYVYTRASGAVKKIADADDRRKIVTLSPTGRFVSYVRDENLFVRGAADGVERQLTRDGSSTRLNGILDWLYQEEVFGRGDFRGHWWRDDDAMLAYLQLDESNVPVYTILDEVPAHPKHETMHYPKAGDPNPGVRLGVLRVPDGGETTWVDLSAYAGDDILVVYVNWGPDGRLYYQVQNRTQTWLDLNVADPATGASTRLLRETSPAWVNRLSPPHWLPDGSFIWESERDGFLHLYHYGADGQLRTRLTSGEWEVRKFHGVDAAGMVYFTGAADSTVEEHVYRVSLAGGAMERLTEPGFSHNASFDAKFTHFIDVASNVNTPPRVDLRRADGGLVRNLHTPAPGADYRLGRYELLRVPAADGVELNVRLLKPHGYSPPKRYPLWCLVYGGPQAQQVKNAYAARGERWLEQYLAENGFLVAQIDPRTAGGRGVCDAWAAHRKLGEIELRDVEAAVDWLVKRGLADPKRVGITGFSYGGYLTAYALTHSDRFALGIAGGSVTDWRYYDSIYTERLMGLPRENEEGYERSSVVKAAGNLRGRLLLVHGLMDENVHFQNSVALAHALQQAGKQFDVMVYPRNRHGIRTVPRHFAELRVRYLDDVLK
jgi:dipeptidyl-peptidase-4